MAAGGWRRRTEGKTKFGGHKCFTRCNPARPFSMPIFHFAPTMKKKIIRNPFHSSREPSSKPSKRNAPTSAATPSVAKETTRLLPIRTHESSLTAEFVNPASTPSAILKCVACIVLYLCLAVLAFSVVFESWSITDALYYAVVTFTTIGCVCAERHRHMICSVRSYS